MQQKGSKEQEHINNQQKDALKNNIAGPIASWPTSGNESKKSGSNLWTENVDTGKHGWNNNITTITTSPEKKFYNRTIRNQVIQLLIWC